MFMFQWGDSGSALAMRQRMRTGGEGDACRLIRHLRVRWSRGLYATGYGDAVRRVRGGMVDEFEAPARVRWSRGLYTAEYDGARPRRRVHGGKCCDDGDDNAAGRRRTAAAAAATQTTVTA